MNDRKYPSRLFILGIITSMVFQLYWLFVPGIILLIAGCFISSCFYIGITLLIIDFIISLIQQLVLRNTAMMDSNNEDFAQFQDALSKDGDVFANIRGFVNDAIEAYEDYEEDDE